MSLARLWYHPQNASNIELVLYDPRDSKALLKEEITYQGNPWALMDSSDVEVEMDYHLLRRIKDKALNLSARLTKSARADREVRGCDMQLVTPEELG
jgi:hypothetical protein